MPDYRIASVVTLAGVITDEYPSVQPATSSQELVEDASHDYDPEAAYVTFAGAREELERTAASIAGARLLGLLFDRHRHPHFPTPDQVRTTFIDPDGQPVATATAAHNPRALEAYVSALARDIARLEERSQAMIQWARLYGVSSARRLAGEAEVSHTTINNIQAAPLNTEALRAHVENTLYAAGIATAATNRVSAELHGMAAPQRTAVTVSTPDWASPHVLISAGHKRDNSEILQRAVRALEQAGLQVIQTRENSASSGDGSYPWLSHVIGQAAAPAPEEEGSP